MWVLGYPPPNPHCFFAQLSILAAGDPLLKPGCPALHRHQGKSWCPPHLWEPSRLLVHGLDNWIAVTTLKRGCLTRVTPTLGSATRGLQASGGTRLGRLEGQLVGGTGPGGALQGAHGVSLPVDLEKVFCRGESQQQEPAQTLHPPGRALLPARDPSGSRPAPQWVGGPEKGLPGSQVERTLIDRPPSRSSRKLTKDAVPRRTKPRPWCPRSAGIRRGSQAPSRAATA